MITIKTPEEYLQFMCDERNIRIESACQECRATGVRSYPSTALWRGGIGGQAFTSGVCNKCWGSGNTDQPWTNLQELEGNIKKLIHEEGEKHLEKSIGARYYEKSYFESVSELLWKESRKRKLEYDYKSFLIKVSGIIKQFGRKNGLES